MNRLKGYILGEVGTGTRQQDMKQNSNRRQSVVPRCQLLLTPSERIHKFHCTN